MSVNFEKITPEIHKAQIEAYSKERLYYETYANVLNRILKNACLDAIPEAIVQARAKTVSSFAEKCARKYQEKYRDPVNQFNDLCGGRVIVQTLVQVQAVCQFIETNFKILEKDDKALLLSENKFGYRDMHYIIQLLPELLPELGISDLELNQIGNRTAEIQVRTWLQHAWADSLHDRIYKNSLKLSSDIQRRGALLAALLEEGDRSVVGMAEELDGMIANYTALASRDVLDEEVKIQRLILLNEPSENNKPGLALKLAHLIEAKGNYAHVVEILEPHCKVVGANSAELLQTLGFSLCKLHKETPNGSAFQRGLSFLEKALKLCVNPDLRHVSHLRKGQSMHARVLSRLGWAESQVRGQEYNSRQHRIEAYEQEPSNPYYLADMLGFEMNMTRQTGLATMMRTVLHQAVNICRGHAFDGIELPYSYFTAGRLSLLLEQPKDSLLYYARGVWEYLYSEHSFPIDVLDEEIIWLRQLHIGQPVPSSSQNILELLVLADRAQKVAMDVLVDEAKHVLIIVGAETNHSPESIESFRPFLVDALQAFSGKVFISGVDAEELKRLVSKIAEDVKQKTIKDIEVVDFMPGISSWTTLLDNGIHPKQVVLLGLDGGGPMAEIEFRIALSLGASVAVVATTGSAEELIRDSLWSNLPSLIPLVYDPASVWAYFASPTFTISKERIEEMARQIHENYRASNSKDFKENMQPWDKLNRTYRNANEDQARFCIQILKACGFGVREVENISKLNILDDFTPAEIELLAELEHGRWNVDRLKDQWRPGPRDNARKQHDCLIPWVQLPENIKFYDREAVIKFPSILAKVGLEVYRV